MLYAVCGILLLTQTSLCFLPFLSPRTHRTDEQEAADAGGGARQTTEADGGERDGGAEAGGRVVPVGPADENDRHEVRY